jgi:hypothetical protein
MLEMSKVWPKNQGPSGLGISTDDWKKSVWDGKARQLCSFTTKKDVCEWAFPNTEDDMRGLRQEYERDPPFKDENNPTVLEIDQWNLRVINHLRKLFGLTGMAEWDQCLFLLAQWAEEAKHTTKWDAKYPPNGPKGDHYGIHPSCEDQMMDQPVRVKEVGGCCPNTEITSEGMLVGSHASVPWFSKMSRTIHMVVCDEGTINHAGPFFRAKRLGIAYKFSEDNKWASLRLKAASDGYDLGEQGCCNPKGKYGCPV